MCLESVLNDFLGKFIPKKGYFMYIVVLNHAYVLIVPVNRQNLISIFVIFTLIYM